MKRTSKITLCAIVSALAAVFMLAGYFPYLTYAIPAVAGLFMMIPLIEAGAFWSFSAYIVSSGIILLIGESETKILYVCLFGFYPILKALIEKIGKQIIEWILKLLVFNTSAIVMYYIMSILFSISFEDFGTFGKYGALAFLGACNAVFVLYDIAISRVAGFYINRLRGKIKRIIK